MEVFAALIDVCTVQSCVYFQASIRETDTTLKHTHFHILPLIVITLVLKVIHMRHFGLHYSM